MGSHKGWLQLWLHSAPDLMGLGGATNHPKCTPWRMLVTSLFLFHLLRHLLSTLWMVCCHGTLPITTNPEQHKTEFPVAPSNLWSWEPSRWENIQSKKKLFQELIINREGGQCQWCRWGLHPLGERQERNKKSLQENVIWTPTEEMRMLTSPRWELLWTFPKELHCKGESDDFPTLQRRHSACRPYSSGCFRQSIPLLLLLLRKTNDWFNVMKLEAGEEQPGQIAQPSVLVLFYFLKGCSKIGQDSVWK